MAVEERRSGGNGFLYFAVGALIVAVAALAWMFYQGETSRGADTAVERMADSVGDTADAIGDSAREAADNLPQAPQPAPNPPPAQPPG